MAAAWPTTNPSYPFEQTTNLAQIKSRFEDGVVQSRPKWTRAREQFNLRWTQLTEAEFQSFKEHFEENMGTTFSWTHPITTVSYTVRYASDALTSVITIPGHRTVRVAIEEA